MNDTVDVTSVCVAHLCWAICREAFKYYVSTFFWGGEDLSQNSATAEPTEGCGGSLISIVSANQGGWGWILFYADSAEGVSKIMENALTNTRTLTKNRHLF